MSATHTRRTLFIAILLGLGAALAYGGGTLCFKNDTKKKQKYATVKFNEKVKITKITPAGQFADVNAKEHLLCWGVEPSKPIIAGGEVKVTFTTTHKPPIKIEKVTWSNNANSEPVE